MKGTKELINIATVENPDTLFVKPADTDNKYIRLKGSYTVYNKPAARFFMLGHTTYSSLNVPNAPNHEISMFPFEPAFHRIIPVIGHIFNLDAITIPIWGGQGMTFRTYKEKGSRHPYIIITKSNHIFSIVTEGVSLGSLSLPSTPIKTAKGAKNKPPGRSSLNYDDIGMLI